MVRALAAAAAAASALAALNAAAALADASASAVEELAASAAYGDDDECTADASSDSGCALNALQLRSSRRAAASEAASGALAADRAALAEAAAAEGALALGRDLSQLSEEDLEASRDWKMEEATGIWHYALPCWNSCNGKAGFCEDYCGQGNACCKWHGSSNDPSECHEVGFWPVLSWYTCVNTRIVSGDANKAIGEASGPQELPYTDPALMKPSDAPVMTFYMYRAQTSQDYDPENQNMGNLAGMLWYLHHEIVWHPQLQRSGSYFSTPKSRIERFKVSMKATQPLHELGMNFALVNAFDSTKCTGPYMCKNFKVFGYAVGCEDWKGGAASFPHGQWVGLNSYPNAVWYSLPGPCSTQGIGYKTAQCLLNEPGGACRDSEVPTGQGNCTYTYKKVGEISLNELEGLTDPDAFKAMGNLEYDYKSDAGKGMDFWNGMKNATANAERVDKAMALFRTKYPDQPELPDPSCDFDRWKFMDAPGMKASPSPSPSP